MLTPDELMAAFNPEYVVVFAATRLGETAAVSQARSQLAGGRYRDALLTVRAALRP